ncbi:shikimate dehydrogenase [Ramlibacter sp. MAHUQ-53]|uniref:shikimate dehydrogenase n=1 Tax=unclassified Ramlibacter TaxID=2617605 RepID=UPI00362BF911
MTDRYAVIGNPIDFSKSPFIHGEFARSLGHDIEYTKILGPLGGFRETVDAFRAAGGRGINITAPFKLDAFAYADERSPSAELAGAVNCLKLDGPRILGENFDGVGLVRDAVRNLGQPLAGRRVLLLGAGGAARGALLPFLAEAPAALVIANRDTAKAQALAAIAARHAPAGTEVAASDYPGLEGQRFDLVFNATSASLRAELPPVPAGVFEGCALAYELAYAKGLTPFLRLAANAGVAHCADGVGMLAEQAAEAFAWWRGVRPDTAAVIEQLRVPLA